MKLKYIAGGCAAAGLIWVVSRITQPFAFFHPYYITQGPLEMCALSVLFYLFGWWRGYVEGSRGVASFRPSERALAAAEGRAGNFFRRG